MSETAKIALVTGASRGIGASIALELGKQGFVVIGTATSESGAAAIGGRLTALSAGSRGAVLDVTSAGSVAALLEDLEARSEQPGILVNNAGITRDNLLIRMKPEEWDQVIAADLTSVFALSRGCLRHMMKARFGRIINITSVVALMGNPGQANYSAAKAGVIGLTRSNAAEFAARGVTVNAVAPGFIESDMTAELDKEPILAAIPMGRMGSAAEVAGAVRFLAADPAAAYMTGQVLQVDGGMVMR